VQTEPPALVVPPVPSGGAAETRLWFIQVDEEGTLSRREVRRPASPGDSPLTAAIQSLLAGPSLQEKEKGYVNLIPEGSRLLSVSIADRVVSLNFSEEFEYNRYGVEGYFGQLEQIIYTATAFPTVDSVQFLIEGQRRDYIGGEGVWIGSPLSRSSIRR
jgi:spore germination protein GerM